MSKSRFGFIFLSAVAFCAAGFFLTHAANATTIAHWSFDSSTLTTDSGTGNILGVGDDTGNHNASVGSGVGSGTGNPYTSNAIPGSNSVTGEFGQGLTLTGFNTVGGGGGQFLIFPELTELMTAGSAAGAPSYTVSYWLKTTITAAQNFTILGDWGLAGTNPGKFAYGFGTNGATSIRAQARENTTGTGNGTDIFARPATTPTLNDNNWHMLTWTFDTNTGTLTTYFDASLVDTFTSTAPNFNMILASSSKGAFGLKGDSGNFINGTISLDEAWVFNQVLTADQVSSLFTSNSIPVPEPTAIVLAAMGALGLVLCRRQKAN